MKRKGHQHVFSWQQLLAVLVACAATLYLLLPDDPTLLENLIEDGKAAAAQRQLDQVTEAAYAADPLRYEVAQQRIDRLVIEASDGGEDWPAYLLSAVRRWQENGFAAALWEIWSPDLGRLVDIEPVWLELVRTWGAMPQATRLSVVDPMVTLALARERPDLAAEVFAATYGEAPPEEAAALELARLRRLQGDPAVALVALSAVESPAVAAVRLGLLRELNRNAEALDLLLGSAAPAEAWSLAALQRLGEVARGAQQSARAIPVVQAFVARHPDSQAAWRLLVVLQRESEQAVEAAQSQARVVALTDRELAELKEWARLLEGSQQPDQAFDVYLEIGRQGDVPALERLVALNPGLFRDRDLAAVLGELVPVPNHDDYSLLYARILANLGRYDESIQAYQLYLKTTPRDRAAQFELAILAAEVFEYELAAEVLRRIKDSGIEEVATRRRLGDVWSKVGEYEQALAEYRAAALASGLPDDYGNFLRMARVLGRYDDFVLGLEGVVASSEATPSDYLTLAYGYQLLGQEPEAKRVMREGMQRFPDNPVIPLRLGYAYGDAQRFQEAQAVMARHPELGTAIEPTRFYLLLMRLNNDLAAERAFLASDLAPLVGADAETRRLLAGAYTATRQLARAEDLLRGLHAEEPLHWEIAADLVRVLQLRQKADEAVVILRTLLDENDPARLQLAVEVYSALGQYGEAEYYQTRYLEMADPVLPLDWGTLGDIRSSRGDFRGSKAAYREAVRVFQAGLMTEAQPRAERE